MANVLLQISQSRRLQSLKINLYLVRRAVLEVWLSHLDDVNHLPQLLPRKLVDVETQLSLLGVRHWLGVFVIAAGVATERPLLWRRPGAREREKEGERERVRERERKRERERERERQAVRILY